MFITITSGRTSSVGGGDDGGGGGGGVFVTSTTGSAAASSSSSKTRRRRGGGVASTTANTSTTTTTMMTTTITMERSSTTNNTTTTTNLQMEEMEQGHSLPELISTTSETTSCCHDCDSCESSSSSSSSSSSVSSSCCRSFLHSSSSNSNNKIPLRFRRIRPSDRSIIQALHEEWFPVRYQDDFYDELVYNRFGPSNEPLYTCLATTTTTNTKNTTTTTEHNTNTTTTTTDDDDTIMACVVGSFLDSTKLSERTRQLLLANEEQHNQVFYIMTLGTVPAYRGYGLASYLVQKCVQAASMDATCGCIYLHVITFNVAAIKLYERLGFECVTEIHNYYNINGELYNCYLYAKYINGNPGHHRGELTVIVKDLMVSLWKYVIQYPYRHIVGAMQSLYRNSAPTSITSSSSSSVTTNTNTRNHHHHHNYTNASRSVTL